MAQYKVSQTRNEGVDMTMHFEYAGLEVVNGKLHRHFRMMPADDFLKSLKRNHTESAKTAESMILIWDDAGTLEPFRILTPDAGLMVFHKALDTFTDEEVEAALTRAHNETDSYGVG